MPFSNTTPDAVARNVCGACGSIGTMRKYVECKSYDRLCAPLYICTACTVIYNATAEFDIQDVEAVQKQWVQDPEFYKVPEGDDFRSFVNSCDTSFSFFEEQLGVKFGGTYLDIGAGNGMRAVSALNFFDKTFVFDHVRERLEATKRAVRSDRYGIVDDREIHEVRADTILIWHAMEHFLSPGKVFKLCGDLAKSSGYLLVQVPVLSYEHVYPGHYYFYNEVVFQKMGEISGFQALRFFYDYEINAMTVVFQKVG